MTIIIFYGKQSGEINRHCSCLYNEILFRGNSTGSMCGTPNYIAPEILVKKGKQFYLKGNVLCTRSC